MQVRTDPRAALAAHAHPIQRLAGSPHPVAGAHVHAAGLPAKPTKRQLRHDAGALSDAFERRVLARTVADARVTGVSLALVVGVGSSLVAAAGSTGAHVVGIVQAVLVFVTDRLAIEGLVDGATAGHPDQQTRAQHREGRLHHNVLTKFFPHRSISSVDLSAFQRATEPAARSVPRPIRRSEQVQVAGTKGVTDCSRHPIATATGEMHRGSRCVRFENVAPAAAIGSRWPGGRASASDGGQMRGEGRGLFVRDHLDVAAVGPGDGLADEQAQPDAAGAGRAE